jgi:hypothetical protein
MYFSTETGIGFFEDADGRVVDYYRLEQGIKHQAGGPRENAIDVGSVSGLPPIDDKYQS